MRAFALVVSVALLAACSPKRMAIDRMAAALSQSTAVYEADTDPEFVRLAAPSTLKTVEMLLAQSPDNPQLLLTACSGFTEYSYAFLHVEAELKAPDAATAQELKARAIRMYQRARGYCVHGLELRHRRRQRRAGKGPDRGTGRDHGRRCSLDVLAGGGLGGGALDRAGHVDPRARVPDRPHSTRIAPGR